MTQAGGPAAINGFLYQILQHLGRIGEVVLAGTIDGEANKDARIILEPITGGDARAEGPGIFLVEQHKTRNGGTWALADIEDVLVDLYKAIPTPILMEAEYRFVTDGRAGKLDAFQAFLTNVKSEMRGEALDDIEKRSLSRRFEGTNRAYFSHLATDIQAKLPKDIRLQEGALFYLLKCFTMQFELTTEHCAEAIDRMIRPYVQVLGDEGRVRRELIGRLMERLSLGEARLDKTDIESLLSDAGLSPHRMQKFVVLSEATARLSRSRMERYRYRLETDVRSSPEWPSEKPDRRSGGHSVDRHQTREDFDPRRSLESSTCAARG
jgi:hypothetical protein